jgi:gag-polypeptide of LTR copia-type
MGPNDFADAIRVIDKFNGEDFHLWKFKMRMVLEEKDLWDLVTGREEHPTDSGEKVQAYERRCRKALATICLNLTDSQLLHVRSATTPAEAWKKLEDLYETKSLANKLFLRRKFFNTPMNDGDTMINHINNVRKMADQLEAIDAPIREEDIVMTLLCSLPDTAI